MNRVIKFRAWDNYQKCMYSFDDLNLPSSMTFIDYCNGKNPQIKLMQFTGLHDVNGREIYEGDIIISANGTVCKVLFGEYLLYDETVEDGCSNVIGFYFESEVDTGKTREPFGSPYNNLKYKVIGNIFENPELLK